MILYLRVIFLFTQTFLLDNCFTMSKPITDKDLNDLIAKSITNLNSNGELGLKSFAKGLNISFAELQNCISAKDYERISKEMDETYPTLSLDDWAKKVVLKICQEHNKIPPCVCILCKKMRNGSLEYDF